MKPAVRLWTMPLFLWGCVSATAAPYPTADLLRQAIADSASQLKQDRMDVEIRDAQKDGIALPLMAAGLRLGDGVCIVYYNATPEDGLTRFFASVRMEDLPVWLNAISVHEMTHCIEQREAYLRRRFDVVLPPGLLPDKPTVQGYLSVVKSGSVETWSETLADIVAVLYFRQAVPDRWRQFAGALAAMRSDLAGKWPEHNTAASLRKIIESDVECPAGQSLFTAAFQVRLKYYAPSQ